MASNVRSQNLSIMLTDIQGYSAAAANASREEIINLIRRHNQLMRPVIEFYGGTIVKSIGDAFLCTFPSATDAVICAIIIQLLLKEYNQRLKEGEQQLNLRVVINSGDVSIEENDIFGNAVNITARMEGLDCFPGGTIGISESTNLLMDRTEIVAEKIGPKELKGVPEPVTVYQVPLEKQKLNKLPIQLLNLVEKVVKAGSADGGFGSAQLGEWKKSVGDFLKQTNWGENIGKAGQHIGNLQSSLKQTFGKKTVIEQKKSLTPAALGKRAKAGIIDLVIIVLLVLGLRLAWWPAQRVIFGSATVAQADYASMRESGLSYDTEHMVWRRNQGFVERIVNFNARYPLLLVWLYFAFFWKLKSASLGQIASGTAVVPDSGDLTMGLAMKRSALFLISCFTIIGIMMVLVGEKNTLYDKLCGTSVVE